MVTFKRANAKSMDDAVFDFVNGLLLFVITALIAYPLVYVVSASFSDPVRIVSGETLFWPADPTFASYIKVFKENRLMMGYANTIMYTVVGTTVNIALTTIGAYPLSRRDFKGRNLITALIMFTMVFKGGMIPTYLLVSKLGMTNTIWAMILPNAIGVTNLVIMRSFFQTSIPGELQEAAMIDGCSNLQIMFRVVLPLSLPIVAVMTIFYSVGQWNEYFSALIYLTDRTKFPLQLVLREILVQNEVTQIVSDSQSVAREYLQLTVEGMRYATIVLASLPMLIVYPFFQRFFVKGVLVGAVKG